MFTETKPFGVIMGLLGNVMIAIAIAKLVSIDALSADLSGVWLLPAGITVSTVAMFLGGNWLVFHSMFLAIGVGALAAGDPFGRLFGGIFVASALLMGGAHWAFWGRIKTEPHVLADLDARGTGTVTGVGDTGMTINGNPRIQLNVRIQPEDGSPAFDATKVVVVSRVAIPRAGDQLPVTYARSNPTRWAYGATATPALL